MKKKYGIIQIIVAFILAFLYFYSLQFSTHNLVDTDGYYHIKLAYIYRTQGLITEFPGAYYTILRDNFYDDQFLFHVLLIPFTFGDLVLWGKIAAVIFASLSITAFYWFLSKNGIAWPLFWAMILLTSQKFVIRANMTRPESLSVLFFILGVHFAISRKYKSLFFISILYSLIHGSFFILSIFIVVYLLINYAKKKRFDYTLIFCNLGGIFLGLFINPYFPKNIYTVYMVYLNGILGILKSVPLSAPIEEWMPLNFLLFINETYVIIILFLISLFFIKKNQNKHSLLFLITSLILFILTMRHNRFVVFWSVATVILCAFTLNKSFKNIAGLWNFPLAFGKRLSIGKYKKAMLIIFILIAVFLFSNFFYIHKQKLAESNYFNNYYNCSAWINNNTPKDTNIFIMTWSQFPALFFYNHDNRYTLGLDEYKMYFYDKELYLKYVGLTREGIRESGRIMNDPEKIRKIIKEDFNSSYIFLDERDLIFTHTYLYNLAKKDNNFKKGYEDAYCSVYRVK